MIFLQLLCLALLGLPLLRLLPALVVSKPLLTLVGTAQQAAKQMIQAYMAGDGAGIAMTAPTYPQMGGGMGNPAMGYGGMGYGGYPAAGGYGQMGGYPQGLTQAPFPLCDLPWDACSVQSWRDGQTCWCRLTKGLCWLQRRSTGSRGAGSSRRTTRPRGLRITLSREARGPR